MIILTEVVLLVFLLIYSKSLLFKKENGFETTQVQRQDISTTVSASGTIEAENQANLHFQSLGKVSWVGVSKGDKVNKWQTLAKLDTTQLNANLQIARSSLRAAEATLERVHDDVKDNDDDESFTQKETRTAAEVAKDNAYEAVVSAQKALANSTLTAPFSGVVISISDNITPGANILLTDFVTVANVDELKFVAQVDEVDYGKIEIGQKVEIFLDAFSDEVFEGTVSYVGKAGNKTVGGGVTIPVDIQFNTNGNNMVVGFNGDVEFIVEHKESVLVVPKQYVKIINGKEIVYILKDGKHEERKITSGLSTLVQIEILEGLEKGEEIVLVKNNKND